MKVVSFVQVIIVLAALSAFTFGSAALETRVVTVSEGVLNVDLGPQFVVTEWEVDTNTSGVFLQDVIVADNSDPSSGFAALFVMDWYEEYAKLLDPVATSNFLADVIIGMFESEEAEVVGNWSAVTAAGQNVTVSSLVSPDPDLAAYGGAFDLAFWSEERTRYMGVLSTLDENTTRQIIGTISVQG